MPIRSVVPTPSFKQLANAVLLTLSLIMGGQAAADSTHEFVSKKYTVNGGWSLVEQDGRTVIRFDENFDTKGGPDLKVFLSPQSMAKVTGKSATDGSLLLGELKSTSGTQDYVIPEDVALSDFSSVLVHCEQYSVLWGGGDLKQAMDAS